MEEKEFSQWMVGLERALEIGLLYEQGYSMEEATKQIDKEIEDVRNGKVVLRKY